MQQLITWESSYTGDSTVKNSIKKEKLKIFTKKYFKLMLTVVMLSSRTT